MFGENYLVPLFAVVVQVEFLPLAVRALDGAEPQ
jgi:hypothetical protein